MSEVAWFIVVYAFSVTGLLIWLAFSFIRIQRESTEASLMSHAKSLDRLATEVRILERECGIAVDWDSASDGKVAYSVKVAPKHSVSLN